MIGSRRRQLVISSIGSALIIPYYLFFTLMIDFAAKAGDKKSGWEIAFEAFAFGGPIIGIVASFIIPRIAAYWMLACAVVSLSIGIGFQIHWAQAPDAVHFKVAILSSYIHEAMVFWLLPVLFAWLLLQSYRAGPTQSP